MKNYFAGIALLWLSVSSICAAQATLAEDKYRTAFKAHAAESFGAVLSSSPDAKDLSVSEKEAFVSEASEGATECHMLGMREYSAELRAVAYGTVAKGGSYLEAKHAFELALAKEGAAGGEREAKVKKMILRAVEVATPCMEKLQSQ
jgi:hypothetical protein